VVAILLVTVGDTVTNKQPGYRVEISVIFTQCGIMFSKILMCALAEGEIHEDNFVNM